MIFSSSGDLSIFLIAEAFTPGENSLQSRKICVNEGWEKTPENLLILGVVLLRPGLEELDASLAQSKRYFDSVIQKDQILRTR
jgi:hypothetical protein